MPLDDNLTVNQAISDWLASTGRSIGQSASDAGRSRTQPSGMISTYAGTGTSSMEAQPGEAPSETEPTDVQSDTANDESFMYSTGGTTDGALMAEETGQTQSRPGAGLFNLLMYIPTRYRQLSATMGDIDAVDWWAFVNELKQIARDYRSKEFTCVVTRSQFLGAPMRVSLNSISVGRAGSERSLGQRGLQSV